MLQAGMILNTNNSNSIQTGAVHRRAALHADRDRHFHQLRGLQKLARAGDGVVVDDARRAESLHARGKDRRRGRIRREGIGRMDMVVDVLRHHRREFSGFQHLAEVFQPFFPRGCVELVQNFNIDHCAFLS